MSWHKNTLLKYKKEITQSAVVSFALSLIFAVYLWHLGNPFVWQSISPIEQPSIFVRAFYSALVFVGPGRYLYYKIKFYQILHDVVVKGFGMWGLYNFIKSVLWAVMFYIIFIVVGVVVDIFNTVASVLINLFNLVLYLSPMAGVFLISTILISYIYINTNKSPVIINSTKN